ncbi:MAG: hypothetical protein HKUEN02_16170 [Anaerolineaceae bacterium]|nr:MAG: hypothetical protein HKUEN02_16170 [Anaerolineaceae bacterium]
MQIVIAVILGLVIKSYLPSYFSKKGENLATKEDIKEITEKVEEIRVEYAKRMHVHEKAFDKEFEVLSELWKALIELRYATLNLRPRFDTVNPNETDEQRRMNRLNKFGVSYNNFLMKLLQNQPFYPIEIFDALEEIRSIAYSEALDYEYADTKKSREYWKKAEENSKVILLSIDKVGELIRQRISVS